MRLTKIVSGKNDAGRPIFSVLVKTSYRIEKGSLTEEEMATPFVLADEYHGQGDPLSSTVRMESELAPFKPFTDVVVAGKAYAPGGKKTRQMDISAKIGGRKKTIRVIGDRQCVYNGNSKPSFTDPEEFSEMAIRYERAYGGMDAASDPDLPFAYPRNPMGRGLALKNVREAIDGLALPNFEDPVDLLTPERVVLGKPENWNRQPIPQGAGWFQKNWYPRCSFAGAMPGFVIPGEPMKEEKLGIVPKNQVELHLRMKLPSFDARFNNGGSIGLFLPHVPPKEKIVLRNMNPEGKMKFKLPKTYPRIMLDIGLGENELETCLHTVLIQPEISRVDLIWRGAHEYPGPRWLPEMKKMRAEVL